MAYKRIIELLDDDFTTVLETLSSTDDVNESVVTHAEFELLRSGGCGGGSLTLNNRLTARNIDVGQGIRFKYDDSTNWYVGRVEEVGYNSSSGATVRLFGLYGMLSDVVVGGLYFGGADRLPHVYARSDWFIYDPDHSLQSFDTCSRYDDFVTMLYNQYVQPNLPFITLGSIIQPTTSGLEGFQSQTFRGGDSVGQIIRHAATQIESASFGVDENSELFMYPKSDTLLKTYQEGVDCTSINYRRDKSLQYTRVWLTGDYIYIQSDGSDFYRYQAVIRDVDADLAYGNKPIKLYVPWVRTVEEAFDFCRGFFRQYAQPTTRVSFRTIPQSTLLRPQDGQVRIRDRNGNDLTVNNFSTLKCTFDAAPYFDIECGPEDIQFGTPPEPNRWELPPNLDFDNGRNGHPPPLPSDPPFSSFTDSYTTTIGNPSLSTPSYDYSTPDPTSYTDVGGSTSYTDDETSSDAPVGSDFCPACPNAVNVIGFQVIGMTGASTVLNGHWSLYRSAFDCVWYGPLVVWGGITVQWGGTTNQIQLSNFHLGGGTSVLTYNARTPCPTPGKVYDLFEGAALGDNPPPTITIN